MIVTNNYGRVITCTHENCKKETIGSFNFTPAFANSMNSVYIAYCEDHKEEANQRYLRGTGEADRINQASSNS